jgi:hypothetical protein
MVSVRSIFLRLRKNDELFRNTLEFRVRVEDMMDRILILPARGDRQAGLTSLVVQQRFE